jgi:hypothetical protein
MSTPIAALAIVLAIAIRARSSAPGSRSSTLVPVTEAREIARDAHGLTGDVTSRADRATPG